MSPVFNNKEVNNHWSDNLIPSPSKKDIISQHVKGPGLHSYVNVEQQNGVKKYVFSPQAQCRSHQRHFMKNTNTALYKQLHLQVVHIYMYAGRVLS